MYLGNFYSKLNETSIQYKVLIVMKQIKNNKNLIYEKSYILKFTLTHNLNKKFK